MGLSTAMERLSSGLRINSAKDDAAGLAVAERMNTQARGMNVAIRNASDAVSMVRTADGGLQQISDTLQRMRELAVQSANGTYGTADRDLLEKEYSQLNEELTRIAGVTKFNNQSLIGSGAQSTEFQVGANTIGSTDRISVAFADTTTTATGFGGVTATGISGATNANALAAITAIDSAIDNVNTVRADFGAAMNRFEATITNLRNAEENQSAARSRIMDADFAAETAALTKGQVLQQAGIAILAQANQAPQSVLGLLR